MGIGVPLRALPLAVVVIVLALKVLPAHAGEEDSPVDNIGGVLSVIGVACLIRAFRPFRTVSAPRWVCCSRWQRFRLRCSSGVKHVRRAPG